MPMPTLAQCLADSPTFRINLKHNEEQLNDVESRVERLIKCSTAVTESGRQFVKNQVNFLSCLHDWSAHLANDNSVSASSSEWSTNTDVTINSFGKCIELFANHLEQTTKMIETSFKVCLKDEICKAKDAKKHFDKISDDLDSCLTRSLQIPIAKASEAEEADNMLTATRSCFYHVSLDYINQLACLNLRRRQIILETLLALSTSSDQLMSKINPIRESLNGGRPSLENLIGKVKDERDSLGKNLEKCQAQVNTFTHLPLEDQSNQIRLEGYLLKKASNAFKTWNRRWFIIRDHKLMYSKRSGDLLDLTVMIEDLRLCSIRSYDIDRRFCFEVVSPGKSHVLQAESYEACKKWKDSLTASIDAAYHEIKSVPVPKRNSSTDSLSSQRHKTVSTAPSGDSSSNSLNESSSDNRRSLRPTMQILASRGNSQCCDCKSPDPRWASINLGITLCIHCSGIHRGLGVQVSRVRSLDLDDWDTPSIKILEQLGNDTCNSVYESKEEAASAKVNCDSSQDTREKWIRAKYVSKKFVDLSQEYIDHVSASDRINHKKQPEVEVCNQLLHQAVQDCNFKNILYALALGADINSKFLGLTCLHHAVQTNVTELTEFLLLNGAQINCTDSIGQTPLHLAVQAGNKGQVALLIHRRADSQIKDSSGREAVAIALEKADADMVTILRLDEFTREMGKYEEPGNVTEELLEDMVRDFSLQS